MIDQSSLVRRRRVFHLPGYDPFPPRRYRELYRTEAAKQAAISGYQIDVQGAKSDDSFAWLVNARIDGHEVLSRVEVLVWSDIVQVSMAQSIPATYWQLIRTAWIYTASGTLRRLMWMRKGPVIAALYPALMLILQLILALLVGRFLGNLVLGGVAGFVTFIGVSDGWFFAVLMGLGTALKLLIWGGVVVLLLRFFKAQDGRLFAYYLMHDYAFTAQNNGATADPLQERLVAFADQIAVALADENVDEVLVVGHSSGAHLAVSIIADVLRKDRVRAGGPALGLLTLGQAIPMVSFLPGAGHIRGDLVRLSTATNITWVDVSAPGDGCSFALCDPVAVTGLTPPGKKWPLVISAAFTQSLSPKRWQELRWRFFRLHFQYLCAFDRPRDYDYFQITAGPVSLGARYKDRPPSKSRIDVAASKYRSIAT